MRKTGRNDLCPCGSGKKYKRCCITKEQPSNKNTKVDPSKNIPGLWEEDLFPQKQYYDTMDEFFNEIRSTGKIQCILSEHVDDDEETGHIHSIEVGQLCRHGQLCDGSVTFMETDDHKWENIESGFGMVPPCILCEILKEGIQIGCPGCGASIPDFTEKEIIEIYEKGIESLDITCPNCGSKFITIEKDKIKVHPIKNTKG